jgi:hypothetical protein
VKPRAQVIPCEAFPYWKETVVAYTKVGHRNILNRTITSAGLQSLTFAIMFIVTAVLRVKYTRNCVDVSSVLVLGILWAWSTLRSYGT